MGLSVCLGELDCDLVPADGELTIFAFKCVCCVCRQCILDKGEALDSTEVLRGLVHILGNIDVLDGAILLKRCAENVGRYKAGKVSGHNGLNPNSV